MLDWQEIDTVFLDMDGTLLDLHFDAHFWLEFMPARYAAAHQLDPDEARIWLHERLMSEAGTLNWYCLDYWTKEFGLPVAELKKELVNKIGYRASVPEFLERVKASGRRSVIVTNAHRDGVNLKLEHTNLANQVDRIISSHDFGYPKEDQAFWAHLKEAEPFDPQRTLMVDDNLAVLRSAHTFGIQHLLTIAQPDLSLPPRDLSDCDFMVLNDFKEVFPTE